MALGFSRLGEWGERLIQLSRHCCACGSTRVKRGTLCQKCREEVRLWQTRENSVDQLRLGSVPIYHLYNWMPGVAEGDRLGAWLRSLKGGTPSAEFMDLAQQMLLLWRSRIEDGPGGVPPTIVPIPSHVRGSCDHALVLARGLGRLSGWPVQEGWLLRAAGESLPYQKQLNRRERSLLHFSLVKDRQPIQGPILIVDDVVTTGATVLAAHQALGRPATTRVWAIAYRERARLNCAAPSVLL